MTRPILPEPPDDLKRLSRALQQRLQDAMGPDGEISFARFMEMALYEPGLGYYSAGLHKLGAAGDFVTAPELGDVFGRVHRLRRILVLHLLDQELQERFVVDAGRARRRW